MIPNTMNRGEVTSTFGDDTEVIPMAVSHKAMPFIMDILTKTYSDEEMAIIREYSTNAADSHLRAKQTRPIEVTTPTKLSPFLRIKDYGVGMDRKDIRETYSQYGESTKRENSDENGSMGIGSKSALAYASQFTVIAVKNSVQISVAVSVGTSGAAQMEVVSEFKTDEPNGVEILIPAKQYNELREKAERLFFYWAKGTVLLNGKDPAGDFEFISEHIAYAPQFQQDEEQDVIVMGGVPYPVRGLNRISSGSRHITAFVAMNVPGEEVSYLPSRETMIYNDVTLAAIETLTNEFNDRLLSKYLNEIATAKSFYHAAVTYVQAKGVFTYRAAYVNKLKDQAEYKGEKMEDKDKEVFDLEFGTLGWFPGRSGRRAADQERLSRFIGFGSLPLTYDLLITEYPGNSVASPHKARIRNYMAQRGVTDLYDYHNFVTLTKSATAPAPIMDGMHTVTWKELLKSTRPEKSSRSSGNTTSDVYLYYTAGNVSHEDDQISDTDVIFYTGKRYWYDHVTRNVRDYVYRHNPDCKIIVTGTNRFARLKRNFPNAMVLDVVAITEKIRDEEFTSMTDQQKQASFAAHYAANIGYFSWNFKHFVSKVAIDKVDDPRYTLARSIFNDNSGNSYRSVMNHEQWKKEYKEWAKGRDASSLKSLEADYPLIDSSHMKDSLMYINTKYALIQERINNA